MLKLVYNLNKKSVPWMLAARSFAVEAVVAGEKTKKERKPKQPKQTAKKDPNVSWRALPLKYILVLLIF